MRLQNALPHQFKQAVDEGWPLFVPTGCIEYHGPHQALGLDTLLVETLLDRVSKRVNCVVAPPFWYGPASDAVSGPDQGSINVSTARFGRHVKDVLVGFWEAGFQWIIVLNADAPWYCDTPESQAKNATITAGNQMWDTMIDAWVERLSAFAPMDSSS